jgi:hypothetical protein
MGAVAKGLGTTVGGFIQGVTATPIPSAPPVVISDAPSIESPSEPYTRSESVDLIVTVPANVAADPEYRIRVYLALPDQASTPIQEASLAAVPRNIVPVTLTKGTNDFTVTVVGPGGESESSAVVRYILDQSKPSLKVTSPADGATVNAKAVKLKARPRPARRSMLATSRPATRSSPRPMATGSSP